MEHSGSRAPLDPESAGARTQDSFRVFYSQDDVNGGKLYIGEKLKSKVVRKLHSLSIEEGNARIAESSDSALEEGTSDASREGSFAPSPRASSARAAETVECPKVLSGESARDVAAHKDEPMVSIAGPRDHASAEAKSIDNRTWGAARSSKDLSLDDPIRPVVSAHPVEAHSDRHTFAFENLSSRPHIRESRPKFISKYVLGARLGEGAYAKVKEAMDTTTLRIVACKIVDKRFLRKVRGGLENVRREIAIMRSLDHPNIVRLLDVIDREDSMKLYIFMELSNGCTVQELMERAPQKRLPPGQAQSFFAQLIEGLAYIHSRNIVHRDIKPSNLMLATDGVLKIADFGVAEFLDKFDAEGRITRTVGSPAFQAPEIARGNGMFLGRKVDAWAAGVTLYMMLTGEAPFKGSNQFELFRNIGRGEFHMPSDLIDEECQDLLRRLMEVNPEVRSTVDDLRDHNWLRKRYDDEHAWIPIPRRHPKILDMVSRLYEDDPEMSTQSTSPIESDAEKSSVQRAQRPTSIVTTQLGDRRSITNEGAAEPTLEQGESGSPGESSWRKRCTLM